VPSSAVVDGLVAWYRFADSSNTVIDYTAELDDDRFADTTAFDDTVNGTSFVENGGVKDVVSGANPSGAYSLDGVDDAINVSGGPFDGLSTFTIMGWVQFDTTVSDQIVVHGNNPNFSFEVATDVSNNDSFGFQVQDGTERERTLKGFTDTTFTHFAGVYTGSIIEWYVNTAEATDSPNDIRGLGNGAPTDFGISEPDFPLNGTADDIRLFNRPLSKAEIEQHFANTKPQ
jgi:hypothetical protein